MTNWIWLGVYCVMQVAVQLVFKYGSTAPQRWLPSFLIANFIGVSSTWALMWLYKQWNANVALALCMGLSFMLSQLALAAIFRSQLSWPQWAGVIALTAGIFLMSWGGKIELEQSSSNRPLTQQ